MVSQTSPAFLIAGATGNTGVGMTETLSSLIQHADGAFKDYRILALTRNAQSATSQRLSKLSKVEIVEKNWVDVNAAWLVEQNIERVFIASHYGPTHFTDESLFLNYAREAGVEYVVRISTMQAYIGPITPVYHGRSHWAIENLLRQPEFDTLKWTSLRPNAFTTVFTQLAQAWLAEYRKTGKQKPFKIPLDEEAPFALVDPYEVGTIAAHLLTQKDISKHASKKYVIVGPENVNGRQAVEILEKHAGTKIDLVEYRDTSWTATLKAYGTPEYLIPSLAMASTFSWDGSCSKEGTPTDPAIMSLYAPRTGALKYVDAALASL